MAKSQGYLAFTHLFNVLHEEKMEYTSVTNPRWADQSNTAILCEVQFTDDGFDDPVPFVATATDCTEHGPKIFTECMAGNYGPIAPWAPYVPDAEENKSMARQLLTMTDWVNQPDVYDPEINPHLTNRDEFIAYRAALRAILVNPVGGILDWPTKPTEQWSV